MLHSLASGTTAYPRCHLSNTANVEYSAVFPKGRPACEALGPHIRPKLYLHPNPLPIRGKWGDQATTMLSCGTSCPFLPFLSKEKDSCCSPWNKPHYIQPGTVEQSLLKRSRSNSTMLLLLLQWQLLSALWVLQKCGASPLMYFDQTVLSLDEQSFVDGVEHLARPKMHYNMTASVSMRCW